MVDESANANVIMDGAVVKKFGIKIRNFLGVFQMADLEKLNIVKNDIGFIIIHNEHAVAVYTDEYYIDVFDSLGLEDKSILSPICVFLKEHLPCKTLRVNTKVQDSGSNTCAKYALLYLLFRSRGHSFNKIVGLFTCDYSANDKKVKKLFKHFF